MNAAFIPTAPPPITITVAAATPGTAQEDAPAAQRLLEEERPGLGRDLARDLAHRGEQREQAVRVLDGLVGDGDRAALLQPLRQLGIGCQVQIGEQGSDRGEAP